ncbi:MAG TPA: PepSY domain-containing protein [Steroidobacteraceae bacterium]|nr:PepSY domain-containing protein [Steroidobacteraceae bacterium]
MNATTWRAIWRWHFHAGLFCIPFVVLLAITGSIYLFKPQIDAIADRDVDRLALSGPAARPAAQVAAALAALPGSRLESYELPREADDAVRIHLRLPDGARRVACVHPQTLQVLKIVAPGDRLTEIVKTLHGELFAGETGSIVVELAACWAIVMILTGLYLWWPRNAQGLAGVLYPRLRAANGTFWRDLHAVTGVWISCLALFLLLTALPWTTVWGGAFKGLRGIAAGAEVRQDWATGRANAPDEHSEHRGHAIGDVILSVPYSLDEVVPRAAALRIAPPVLVVPPSSTRHEWTIRGESQNRSLRRELSIDAHSGAIVRDQGFAQRAPLDRVIGIGISAHEGQLFGLANQLLGLLAALGLITLCVSAVVLWWRKKPQGELGVPAPRVAGFRLERGLATLILALALLLPVFGASLLVVAAADRWLFTATRTAR